MRAKYPKILDTKHENRWRASEREDLSPDLRIAHLRGGVRQQRRPGTDPLGARDVRVPDSSINIT
jgi:hypothetical protein